MAAYTILENPPATSHLWKQWTKLVNDEGWTVDDNVTTALIPVLPTTRSVFAVTEDNTFIGCVIWNEYDDICWLGYFLLLPKWRGKGIGSKIWGIAMERYSKKLVLGLRGVIAMAAKYKAQDCPISGPIMHTYRMKTSVLKRALEGYKDLNLKPMLISDLDDLYFQKLLTYDKIVCGRDRSQFLKFYYKDYKDYKLQSRGFIILDENDQIQGIISMVPTSHPSENFFKISHLYADSDDVAFFAMKTLSIHIIENYNDSNIVIHTVDLPNNVFKSFFKDIGVNGEISGYTLSNQPISAHGDTNKVYIPHNSSCHFDY